MMFGLSVVVILIVAGLGMGVLGVLALPIALFLLRLERKKAKQDLE